MKKLMAWLTALALCFGASLGPVMATAEEPGIPPAGATAAFPVGAGRDVLIDNENARELIFRNDAPTARVKAFIVPEAVARVRISLAPPDDPFEMACCAWNEPEPYALPALLNEGRTAYALDVPVPRVESDGILASVRLMDSDGRAPENAIAVYLIPGEEALDDLCDDLAADGWRLSEESDAADGELEERRAYALYAVDQYGKAVPGVIVTFCTDQACFPAQADAEGVITFAAAPDLYHVQVLRVPAGYSFDRDFELQTGDTYAAWQLRIRRSEPPR